jgi:beta-N-acetylhexosaminidase
MRLQRVLSFLFVLLLLAPAPGAVSARAPADWQTNYDFERARQLLADMTPEERVGQLFLVTFTGSTAGPDSQIYDLIVNHHIGGVVLLARNDNFVDSPNTLVSAAELIAQLQTIEWSSSQGAPVNPETGGRASIQYIPLLVGITHPAAGSPDAQILSGLTPLPSQMAIGAAWDVSLAERVGEVAGDELSRLGFNVIFGPSLDVLEDPEAALLNGLGADTFGGDPFWVGQMGQAYIRGLHSGSGGQMLVVARNFPGRGSTDRPPGEEPPTVRKSLEQLKQIELAPFFAVTGSAPDAGSVADGLLVSHIRYQGFQGNIRATTRPVSFDSQALSQILSLPNFTDWRAAGGLLVSDDLGSQTVRRFYDPARTNFQARIVARDAFLAGNDLLYLGNIQSSDAPDTYSTIINILAFFAQKYQEDAAFAKRVDESVVRILAAKYRVFQNFTLEEVVPPADSLGLIGNSDEITFETARRAATLVSPSRTDLDAVLPEPPGLYQNIVFITDVRPVTQCTNCAPLPALGVNDMQNAVLRLYGPHAGELVTSSRLLSYSLEDIAAVLPGGEPDQQIETSLSRANWIIINILDAPPGQPQTTLLRRFLSERQDLLRNKYVVVFAFDAPYYLDATDISNLTAYYGLYSSAAPFLDVAVRLLFRELTPGGALPVSVPGVGYDLFSALSPDPSQVILLSLDLPPAPVPTDSATPETPPTPAFRVGDTITVRTGVLLDHNGNPVPDGTSVQFFLAQSGVGGLMQQVDAVTSQGVALATFSIERPGLLEIRAVSEPAMTSVILQMDVSGDAFSVTVVAPTSEVEPLPTAEIAATPESNDPQVQTVKLPGFPGWLLMVALLGGLGWLAYYTGLRLVSSKWGLRWGLCALLGGLVGYTCLAMRLPGAGEFLQRAQYAGIAGVTIAGALLGAAAGYLWRMLTLRRR